jgi:hypothetical protein
MNKPNRRRTMRAEIHAAAKVLRQDWDPIGHAQMDDLPLDEYDAYAPQVVSLLEAGASDRAIVDYKAKSRCGEIVRMDQAGRPVRPSREALYARAPLPRGGVDQLLPAARTVPLGFRSLGKWSLWRNFG